MIKLNVSQNIFRYSILNTKGLLLILIIYKIVLFISPPILIFSKLVSGYVMIISAQLVLYPLGIGLQRVKIPYRVLEIGRLGGDVVKSTRFNNSNLFSRLFYDWITKHLYSEFITIFSSNLPNNFITKPLNKDNNTKWKQNINIINLHADTISC